MTRFGEIVRYQRKLKGWTMQQLADRADTSKSYISSLESGAVAPPSPAMTREIARALGVDSRRLVLLGWAEKAPKECRREAELLVGKL